MQDKKNSFLVFVNQLIIQDQKEITFLYITPSKKPVAVLYGQLTLLYDLD